MIGLRTLVLNASYMPISLLPLHTVPVEDAVGRIFNDSCHVVFSYNRKILSPSLNMNWPSVIARNSYVNVKNIMKLKRESLYYRDHGVCVYCEKPLTIREVTYDHVIPKLAGGLRIWENVVSACSHCNALKANKDPVGQWKPKWRPFKPNYHQLLARRKKFPIVIDHPSWQEFFGDWESDVILRI
jgi:5-methylcytosine-specific restriction endonuclease McrA